MPVEFTKDELIGVSLLWGFTLGFGYFVVYHAICLSRRLKRVNAFIVLVWLEIVACIGLYGLPTTLMASGTVSQDSLWIWLCIIIGWAIQLQCIIQIIANRLCILIDNRQRRKWLKLGLFLWIGFINITVACVWVPAVLQISTRWMEVNKIYDRVEKILYLITDAGLNFYFIRTVQQRLIAAGLTKYNRLLRFNKMIVWVSIAMDVLIIGFMFMKNPLVYLMVHPLAFMVKLEIEMAMSRLIVLIALGSGIHVDELDSDNSSRNSPHNLQSVQVSVSVHHEATRDYDRDEAYLNNDIKPSRDVIRMRTMGHSVQLDSKSGADFGV